MAVLSTKKKKPVPKAPKRAIKHVYEPSQFVWLQKYNGEPRQPALVLYAEDVHGMLVVYVTPKKQGDTGRRDVPSSTIEGMITP